MTGGSVFQVGGSDLFDSVAHSQGGQPHLLQFLWDEYWKYLQAELDKRTRQGVAVFTLDEAKRKAPAVGFLKWATAYLAENRAAESFFLDANLGVRLTNNVAVAICPGVELRGTMQDANAVQVTEGRSQPHQDGIAAGPAFRV